ncbi:MAG TPA: PEP-CTERM-box response regulator transcription factor [Candidatus Dormibacteraeota bacterium]|nr:PEP-CTERM-box response regulator transcription factor [Candidatus Dormibacteraeota bacterium]
MNPKLLIVDDDEEIRAQMKWALNQDYDVLVADNCASAVTAFRDHQPPVVLLDLGLPPHPGTPQEGMTALAEILESNRNAKVIIISGQGDKGNALQAVGAGAYDFLSKPVDVQELKIILKRTFHVAALERDYHQMQQQMQGDSFEGMLGTSPKMQAVFNSVRKVATSDAPVLILGESGTGKEMVALGIHRRSPRKDGPFVPINCGAIPETLLESELFGHEKGSFTGAHVQRKGRIESAAGGTLFLDEIGELPGLLQVKLLRFLQEGTLERVGGRQPIRVDTRVVAATNVDLKKAIAESRFREDLFYRLAVVVINLPALRERDNDIQLVAQEFLRRSAEKNGKHGLSFGPDALKALVKHPWPGNVRELENRVKRAVIMAEGKRLAAADLELTTSSGNQPHASLKEARESVEREMVLRALNRSNGKIAPAATELGISRPTMYELMEKLGIHRAEREGKSIEVA